MKISELSYQYKIEFRHRSEDITFRIQSHSLKFVINFLFNLKENFDFKIFIDNDIIPFVQGGTYLNPKDSPMYVILDMFEFLKGVSFK